MSTLKSPSAMPTVELDPNRYHDYIVNGDVESVKALLLSRKVSPNDWNGTSRANDPEPPLVWAAKKGKADVMNVLAEHGADALIRGVKNEWQVRKAAFFGGNQECIKIADRVIKEQIKEQIERSPEVSQRIREKLFEQCVLSGTTQAVVAEEESGGGEGESSVR